MTPDDLVEALALGERRHIEFKEDGSLGDGHYVARVVRAVLGMANRRDGGAVVLGVDDENPASSSGMTSANGAAWSHFDDVADQVAKYADPGVDFAIGVVNLEGATFVVVQVEEFREVPVICKKAYAAPTPKGEKVILRRGALYVRPSAGKIETREIANVTEMRTLVDLAAEKRLEAHIAMTARAGGVISSAPSQPTAADLFAAELGDLA